MFSFPLFERLKAELPEFEEIAAFQAGGPRVSVSAVWAIWRIRTSVTRLEAACWWH